MVEENSVAPIALLPNLAGKSFKNQWRPKMPNDTYHSIKDHMSSSGLKELLRSPRHYYYKFGLGNATPQTPAMRIGNLVHAAILEPERYQVHLKVMPKFDLRTKKGKEAKADFMGACDSEDIVVSQEDHDLVLRVIEQVYSHPIAKGVLVGGQREWSGFFREPITGVKGRIRPDLMVREEGMILDVKTTTNASKLAFERQISQFRYDVQAAWYLHGAAQIDREINWNQYLFLAVEKTEPYVSSLYMFDQAGLEVGEVGMKKALKSFVECQKTGGWPGYQQQAEYCSVPEWMMAEVDYEAEVMEGAHE